MRYVETEAVSGDESIYALRSLSDRKHYHADVRLSTPGDSTKITCKFQIDTGASCSTLAFADYKYITKAPLQPSHAKLKLYDNSILQPLGSVTVHCEVKRNKKKNHLPSCELQLTIITFRPVGICRLIIELSWGVWLVCVLNRYTHVQKLCWD